MKNPYLPIISTINCPIRFSVRVTFFDKQAMIQHFDLTTSYQEENNQRKKRSQGIVSNQVFIQKEIIVLSLSKSRIFIFISFVFSFL
jgi:hypothetical protein